MRVLVVDDSAFMRRAISRMLRTAPDIQVVDTACNGREAVAKAAELRPDLITLDIEMPEMDGLTALRQIMARTPTPVLMLSSLTTEGSHAALRALSLGAADFLAKDTSQISMTIDRMEAELVDKVRAIVGSRSLRPAVRPASVTALAELARRRYDLICIGSSTGGPPVLEKLLKDLPASFQTPIVIAQHMPVLFTESMAARLGQLCALPVRHVAAPMALAPATVHVARGDMHLHVTRRSNGRIDLFPSVKPVDAIYRPSVDALFGSAAQAVGTKTLAIVLTGIGQDGLEGARQLHATGAACIAQSQETCVVYGMPKAVTENAVAAASLSPAEIVKLLQAVAAADKARP